MNNQQNEKERDPYSLAAYSHRFLRDCQLRNYSAGTIEVYGRNLSYFINWCDDRALQTPHEITPPILARYRRYLFNYRGKGNKALSQSTQARYLAPVRSLFGWLTEHNIVLYNASANIEMPKRYQPLPRQLLSAEEIETILQAIDLDHPLGLRDRSLLETLYATGMRSAELVKLALDDVDMEQGLVMIREGKGGHDRRIPMGDRAVNWLERYLQDCRPNYKKAHQHEEIYLSSNGVPIWPNKVGERLRDYKKQVGIEKSGGAHQIRHSVAALMLENGADIRFIQVMLGHKSLKTTQIYTQVSNRALKSVHEKTHPAELKEKNRLKRKNSEGESLH